ncbi:MAG: oxidoreductase [Candidatus Nephthysia bennettiae]|nr:MAG: oxidoreductase [Candidatus Dormibacteraeota bacterium]
MPELAGRVAVVTGGSSGIGAAVSDRLEAAGALVHRVSRRGPVAVDVTDRAAVQRFVGGLERLDILVCAAADNIPDRELRRLTAQDWDRVVSATLTGAFNFVHAGLDKLLEWRGDVLFVGSVSASWPDMSGAAYQAGKAALLALARAAGFELHTEGVRFSVVNPGLVDTPMLLKRPVSPAPELTAQMLRPEDVADCVIFMLSLPRRAWIPELTILPIGLQAIGKTSPASPGPPGA